VNGFCTGLTAVLLLVAWLPASLRAAEVKGLYQATVPVADQSADARRQAFGDALTRVLVKVTGQAQPARDDGLAQIIGQASRFVQQYRYQAPQAPADAGAPTAADTPALMLWARFDPDALGNALRDAGEPVWGRERPVTLAWIAVQSGAERDLVGTDADSPVIAAANDAANARGIPVVLPLMDLEDRGRISFTDVWAGFEDHIRQASARYDADALLVGRVSAGADGQWSAHWTLYQHEHVNQWDSGPADLAAVVHDGVDGTADLFANRFALPAIALGGSRARVQVSGVSSLDAYGRVLNFLNGLSVVDHVGVDQVQGNTVTYSLDLRGEVRNLRQAISLGHMLEEEAQPQLPTEDADLPPMTAPINGNDTLSVPDTAPAAPSSPPIPLLSYHYQS
jgi:hypothetical protein